MPHALARDHDVAFAPVAADAQHDRRSLRAADHADGALVAEAGHRRAVDGEDLVARHEARIRGASTGAAFTPTPLTALLTGTEYVLPQPDACWVQILVQNDAEFAGFSQGNWQAFTPVQHVTANWTAQPSRPGSSSREQTSPSRAPPADRATR